MTNPAHHMAEALGTILPPQVALERARNIAHILMHAPPEDQADLWKHSLDAVVLRLADAVDDVDDEAVEAATLACLRAWLDTSWRKKPSEWEATWALRGIGVPKNLLTRAA